MVGQLTEGDYNPRSGDRTGHKTTVGRGMTRLGSSYRGGGGLGSDLAIGEVAYMGP